VPRAKCVVVHTVEREKQEPRLVEVTAIQAPKRKPVMVAAEVEEREQPKPQLVRVVMVPATKRRSRT
jgi:hypothetical protein